MPDQHTNIENLIDTVRRSGAPSVVSTGAVAMLNLIPFAGGAVAGILGEFSSQRRIEKICDVLAHLNVGLESRQISAEAFLSRDQIVELVYDTLQAASVASDQEKIDVLKSALVEAFIKPGAFDRKQLFLQMLRETTTVELRLLRTLYDAPDVFIVGRQGPSRTSENWSPKHPHLVKGFWTTQGRIESPGGQTLLKYLVAQAQLDAAMVEGGLRRLDGRGLSAAAPNFDRSDMKVVVWINMPEEHIAKLSNANIGFEVGKPFPSPLEASRTKLGSEFLRFCHSGNRE